MAQVQTIWTVADTMTGSDVSASFDETDAVDIARARNAEQTIVGRFQVERSLLIAGQTV